MKNNGSEVLVLSRGQVVEPLMDTLVIHLVTLLCKAGQVWLGPYLLDHSVDVMLG